MNNEFLALPPLLAAKACDTVAKVDSILQNNFVSRKEQRGGDSFDDR